MSALGFVPDDIEFEFNPVETPSQKDKAELIYRTIEAIKGCFDSGILSQQITLKELREAGEPLGLFTNITDQDIEEASDELDNDMEVPDEGTDRQDVQGDQELPGEGTEEAENA
jgi:hypothetical protein